MKKIKLTAKSFNSIRRNIEGAKVQRVWIPELKGLGVDLGKTKKSIIYKYKTPTTGKFRITSLDSFSYCQKLDNNQIEDIVDDYYQLRRIIRNGVDPLAEKDTKRQEEKQSRTDVQLLKLQGKAKKTVDSYSRAICRVTEYFSCCPSELNPEQLQDYFAALVESHSWSTVKTDRLGLQFYWKHVLCKDWDWINIVKPPKVNRLSS